jgi:hypothetical protein
MDDKKKPLEQLLIEHGAKQTAGQSAKNYAAFMERWDEICAAYDKGWSYLAIWKALHAEGVFAFSYPAFTGYIRKVKGRQEKGAQDKKALANRQAMQGRRMVPDVVDPNNPSPTRVDLPVFGKDKPPRDPKRF